MTLRNPANALIASAVSYNATTRTVTLNPNANLAAGTTYTVTLTGGPAAIRSTAGVALPTTSWSFTTAGAAGNPAPTVTVQTPAANATGVSRSVNVRATFSEPVQGVTNATFVLTNTATGAVIAGVIDQPGARAWRLNPNAALARNTNYTVTLTGGATAIRDLTNIPLATVSWSFTTAP